MPESPLAQSLKLPCGAVLPNRLAKAAMTEGLADDQLHATHRHETLYSRWSDGGAGLLITGNVMIDHRVLERPGNVAIDPAPAEGEPGVWRSCVPGPKRAPARATICGCRFPMPVGSRRVT